jgi:hypothetical protein
MAAAGCAWDGCGSSTSPSRRSIAISLRRIGTKASVSALAAVLAVGMLGKERQLRSDVGSRLVFRAQRPTGTGSCTASADGPRTDDG